MHLVVELQYVATILFSKLPVLGNNIRRTHNQNIRSGMLTFKIVYMKITFSQPILSWYCESYIYQIIRK